LHAKTVFETSDTLPNSRFCNPELVCSSSETTRSCGRYGIRILNVHLKSGCFDSYLTNMWWLNQADWSPNGMRDHACTTLARQLPELRAWVLEAKPGDLPFVIIGDFNRRLDVEQIDNKSLTSSPFLMARPLLRIPPTTPS